ncbi:helix-turn-helix domain-containing protein [Zhongshania guokunii]|uniref:Helix-turn-helix domain-containing protein n=1 Tax=Zhongshania guokunii TaxID=641783 RepID=A0ABV3U386_9GAMM
MWNENRYEWVRMPSWWMKGDEGLSLADFSPRDKGASIAALMLYIMLCTRAVQKRTEEFQVGTARVTYDDIADATGLSRAMIRKAVTKLEANGMIRVKSYRKQNIYEIVSHDVSPWAKLPKKHLYGISKEGQIGVFVRDFHLRAKNELNALKLYCVLLAFRDNDSNVVFIGYEAISEYTGIVRNEIRSAISFLVTHDLIHLDKVVKNGVHRANRYEIRGVSHIHAGNRSEK